MKRVSAYTQAVPLLHRDLFNPIFFLNPKAHGESAPFQTEPLLYSDVDYATY